MSAQRTDARNVQTNYKYDGLNRLVGVSYTLPTGSSVAAMPNVCNTVLNPPPTAPDANVCFFYDEGGAAQFALGRKTRMVDNTGSEKYTYDRLGQVTQLQKVISGTTYTAGYGYNSASEVTSVTYPSGRIVQQSYDAIGRLCEIAPQTTGCGTATSPYATGYSYNPASQVTGFNYGNGVAGSFGFSPDRLQLTSLGYAKGPTNLFSLSYWYKQDPTNCASGATGNNSQIQCITDAVDSGRTVSYTYDALRRLSTAVTNGSANYPKWGLSWTYDRYGNRLNQTQTAGSPPTNSLSFANPGGAQTNRPDGYTFDANGNLTVEPIPGLASNNYTYDAENRLASFQGGGSNTYSYDGNGLRVRKCAPNCTGPTSSTVYIFSGTRVIAEYDNGAAPASPSREYIYSGAQLLATVTGSGPSATTTYHHADHLSVRLTADSNGSKIGEQGHFPYGESWYSANTTTKWLFTSYERDAESGLDYGLARYYSTRLGRFCSADPAGLTATRLDDPQTLNLYAYVRNDPVDLTDPSGLGLFSFLKKLFRFLLGHHPRARLIASPPRLPRTPPTFPRRGDSFDFRFAFFPGDRRSVRTPPFIRSGLIYGDLGLSDLELRQNCILQALNNTFGGTGAQFSVNEPARQDNLVVGGHLNTNFQARVNSQQSADIQQVADRNRFLPPWNPEPRVNTVINTINDSRSVTVHATRLDPPQGDPGTFGVRAHIDLANPNDFFPIGALTHLFRDYLPAHLFGKEDLDFRCAN